MGRVVTDCLKLYNMTLRLLKVNLLAQGNTDKNWIILYFGLFYVCIGLAQEINENNDFSQIININWNLAISEELSKDLAH